MTEPDEDTSWIHDPEAVLERVRQRYEARRSDELGLRVQRWNRDGFMDIARRVVDELGEAYVTIHSPLPRVAMGSRNGIIGAADNERQIARLWTGYPPMSSEAAGSDGYAFGRGGYSNCAYPIIGTTDPYFGLHARSITSLELNGQDHGEEELLPNCLQARLELVNSLRSGGIGVIDQRNVRISIMGLYFRNIGFYQLHSADHQRK